MPGHQFSLAVPAAEKKRSDSAQRVCTALKPSVVATALATAKMASSPRGAANLKRMRSFSGGDRQAK